MIMVHQGGRLPSVVAILFPALSIPAVVCLE